MREFNTPEALREYLLNVPGEFDEELSGSSGNCFSLSWKKDHWIIRVNNKRVGIITKADIPPNVNLNDSKFVLSMSSALRNCNGSLDKLRSYLRDLKNEKH